jgi:hypothetical protein
MSRMNVIAAFRDLSERAPNRAVNSLICCESMKRYPIGVIAVRVLAREVE